MDDFDLEIKKEFISEALTNLEEAEGAFMELEGSNNQSELLNKIFRMAHNLKGGSRAVGFGSVAEFTHNLESLVLKLQKKEVQLNSEVITTLLRCNDRLVEMLTDLSSNISAQYNNTDLLNLMLSHQETDIASSSAPTPVIESKIENPEPSILAIEVETEKIITTDNDDSDTPPLAEQFFSDDTLPTENLSENSSESSFENSPQNSFNNMTQTENLVKNPDSAIISATEGLAVSKPKTEVDKKSNPNVDEVVRVNLTKINRLNDFVGELIVLQSVIQEQCRVRNFAKLNSSIGQMTKLSKEIQEISMGLRMLPVKPMVQKLQRVVRDTAKALNRNVDLKVYGDHIEIEKTVLDVLTDPLVHVLRNAVDHGLEDTQDRLTANKPSVGTVSLTFQNDGNNLVVEVRDDGKGIDTEKLKIKAIEKGLIQEKQSLSDKQIINLIFHPGFSTKAVTSEISGRGVGMDVVRTNIERVGGNVDVTTKVGQGSIFKINIPLSLAVIEGLVVRSSTNRYIIPLDQVKETINLGNSKIHTDRTGLGNCFELRGQVIPILSVEEAFGSKLKSNVTKQTALIVSVGEKLMALTVDEILRSQQIVIKPLGNGVTQQKGLVGTCVLGDGIPTLILRPQELLANKIEFYLGKEHFTPNSLNKLGEAA